MGRAQAPGIMLPVLAITASLMTSEPPQSVERDYNAPWRQGRSRLGFAGGASAFTGGPTTFYLGATYGYFVVDNLELGIDALFLFGGDPGFMLRTGPALTFIVPFESEVQPYIGAFYRHWFIPDSTFLDQDTIGGKLGIILRSSVFLQVGIVVEHFVSECNDELEDCTVIYPELGFSIGF